jgi:hypothetical protein
MVTASNDQRLRFSKPAPRREVKRQKDNQKKALARKQQAEVSARSRGQCELCEAELGVRCTYPATDIHHLLGGHGRRNVGESALAKNLIHICREHHIDVHNHVGYIKPLDEENPAGRVVFVRQGDPWHGTRKDD